jgi:flagellin
MSMPLSINTNIASLQAQNNLSQVNRALEQNQERLSSGLRINSAADDAAGLAISDRMTAQVKGMNQATRNAQNGISMAQTAEGGMQEITNILQRMRELAVQSANETNTASDRESLNQEFQDLSGELDRIAQATSFNGKSLLDGSMGKAQFQVGADTGSENVIQFDMSNSMRAQDLGKRYEGVLNMSSTDSATAGAVTMTGGELSINGETVNLGAVTQQATGTTAMPADGQVRTSAWGVAEAINNESDVDVTAEAQTLSVTVSNTATVTVSASSGYSLTINNEVITAVASATTTMNINATDIADAINSNTNLNITAEATASGIQLVDEEGGNISAKENASSVSGGTGFFVTGSANTTNLYRGEVELVNDSTFSVVDGTGGAGTQFTNFGGTSGTVTFASQNSGVESMDVSTVKAAQDAIDKIDKAIMDVDSTRGDMGAAQNRLESTIANLENSVQNLTEARSRIKDADIAKEAAEQTMNNVRRQASASVLTQANQNPQLALQLLGG